MRATIFGQIWLLPKRFVSSGLPVALEYSRRLLGASQEDLLPPNTVATVVSKALDEQETHEKTKYAFDDAQHVPATRPPSQPCLASCGARSLVEHALK